LYRKRISKIGYGEELYLLDCYSAGVEIFLKKLKTAITAATAKIIFQYQLMQKLKK